VSASSIADPGARGERIIHLPVRPRQGRLRAPFLSGLVWCGAALAVYAVERGAQGALRNLGAGGIALTKIIVIVAAAAVYARAVRGAEAGFVMATGLAWLTLSIVADVAMGFESVDVGYRLLGDPSVPPEALRDLIIFTWLAAPALFARSGERVEFRNPVRWRS
jgi:hypothetical protein